MKIRNRNYISAMRKQIEQLENYKKEDKKGNRFFKLDEATSIIRGLEFELLQIKNELTSLHNKNSGINTRALNIERAVEKLKQKYGERFSVEEDTYTVKFPTLHLNRNGKDLLIGDIELEFDFYNISFLNPKEKVIDNVTYQHPHIKDNYACFGKFNTYIYKSISDGHLDVAVELIWEFLNTYNELSPFLKLSYWDPSIEYCEECGNLQGDCECEPEII